MNDFFLESLQRDWRSQRNDVDIVLRRLRRRRWVPHLVLGAEILACALTFLVGAWFAWVAIHDPHHRVLYALSAAVLMLAAPVLGIASVRVRGPALAWDVETPQSLLGVGLRRAESSLRAIRIGRWHIGVIAVFVITLWALQAIGLVAAADFLVFYSLVCAGVSAAAWRWMAWRERRARSERAACLQMLAALASEADHTP
jgi:hypothetical protein